MIVGENEKLSDIRNKMNDDKISDLKTEVDKFLLRFKDETLKEVFKKCFYNTIHTTTFYENDGSVFLITGDIPAMWLRDSSVQVMQYLYFANECESVRTLIKGVLKKQFEYILIDPYANAFNRTPNAHGHIFDEDKQSPWVWERKFELDSLTYPLWLIYKYYSTTKDSSVFDGAFYNAFDKIIEIFKIEQSHFEKSTYYHTNKKSPQNYVGRGTPVKNNGMVWSGYRPSDDLCKYGYYLPGNMFIVTVLTQLETVLKNALNDEQRAEICRELAAEIQDGIKDNCIVTGADGKKIYALETDGLGNYNVMDDANVPNLLAMPYYEYPYIDKEVYANTREFMLSSKNPYYFVGKKLKGIGSPHTRPDYIWPLAIIIQALTSDDKREINDCVQMLVNNTGGTGYMHESINKDDDTLYSRPWFAWANTMFSILILKKQNLIDGIE